MKTIRKVLRCCEVWKLLSRVWLFMTPRTIHSMEFSRPEYWSERPFPSPGDLPKLGIEPRSPTLQEDSLPAEPQGKPKKAGVGSLSLLQQIFPTQESNWGLLHWRWILYQLSYQGSPPCMLGSPQKHKAEEDSDKAALCPARVHPSNPRIWESSLTFPSFPPLNTITHILPLCLLWILSCPVLQSLFSLPFRPSLTLIFSLWGICHLLFDQHLHLLPPALHPALHPASRLDSSTHPYTCFFYKRRLSWSRGGWRRGSQSMWYKCCNSRPCLTPAGPCAGGFLPWASASRPRAALGDEELRSWAGRPGAPGIREPWCEGMQKAPQLLSAQRGALCFFLSLHWELAHLSPAVTYERTQLSKVQ